jgi:hypothetical protein
MQVFKWKLAQNCKPFARADAGKSDIEKLEFAIGKERSVQINDGAIEGKALQSE